MKHYKRGKQEMQKILEFIIAFRAEKGYSPTYAQIAVGIGRKATDMGNINAYVKSLVEEGFLTTSADTARALIPVQYPPRWPYYEVEEEVKE